MNDETLTHSATAEPAIESSTKTVESKSAVITGDKADLQGIQPVHIDGVLYVLMAVAASIVASLSTDEAIKLISSLHLFVWRTIAEVVGAGAGALKMYRSTSYSNSRAGKL